MAFFKSKTFHHILTFFFSVASVYSAAKYPAYAGLIAAAGASAGLTITNSAYNQTPPPKF